MQLLKKIYKKLKKKKADKEIRDFSFFRELKESDIFIDCGANVGQEVKIAAKTGATVHAFEPNPYAFEELNKNYGYKYKNITCYPQAVHDHNGSMKLYFHSNSQVDPLKWSQGSSLLAEKGNVNKEDYYEVSVVDIAEFIKSLNKKVKLLKVDIEGAEYEVINRLIDSGVYANIENILVETHARKMKELEQKDKDLRTKIKTLGIKNINLDWI